MLDRPPAPTADPLGAVSRFTCDNTGRLKARKYSGDAEKKFAACSPWDEGSRTAG